MFAYRILAVSLAVAAATSSLVLADSKRPHLHAQRIGILASARTQISMRLNDQILMYQPKNGPSRIAERFQRSITKNSPSIRASVWFRYDIDLVTGEKNIDHNCRLTLYLGDKSETFPIGYCLPEGDIDPNRPFHDGAPIVLSLTTMTRLEIAKRVNNFARKYNAPELSEAVDAALESYKAEILKGLSATISSRSNNVVTCSAIEQVLEHGDTRCPDLVTIADPWTMLEKNPLVTETDIAEGLNEITMSTGDRPIPYDYSQEVKQRKFVTQFLMNDSIIHMKGNEKLSFKLGYRPDAYGDAKPETYGGGNIVLLDIQFKK